MGKNTNPALEKTFSAKSVWAIALGSIVGFGCFILPPEFMKKAGPAGAVVGLALGAALMLLIGRSISFMIGRLPVAGGQFAFAYKMFGTRHAFVCGWMLSLGFLSIIALNATALAVLGKFLAPGLFSKGYLYTIAGWDVYAGEIILSSLFILLFAFFNWKGGSIAGKLQLGMVIFLILAVALVGAGTMSSDQASFSNLAPPFASGQTPLAGILAIVAMAPWLYVGFDTIPQSAEEYNFPPQKTFRLVLAAIFSGALIYSIVCLSTGMVWPWEQMVEAKYNWATGSAMQIALGPAGVLFLSVAICMGIFTGMNGFYIASSRLMLGMARAHMLPKWFGYIHPAYRTPSNAILFSMFATLIAPWFGRSVINWVVDMCSVGTAIGYLYTCLGAFLLIRRQGRSPHELWPGTALLGGVCSLAILMLLLVPGMPGAMAMESWAAFVLWSSLGLLFYCFSARNCRRISRKELDALILGPYADCDPLRSSERTGKNII